MIAIPNMDMPETCDMCPIEGCEYINGKFACPLIEIVTCGECKKVDTKKCPMYSAGWGYTDDDWCSEGERRSDEHNTERD
jgi:hypothetical protein